MDTSKITQTIKKFKVTCLIVFSLFAASANATLIPSGTGALLNVDANGQLLGAKNVLVDGVLWDMTFADGTFNDLYVGSEQYSFELAQSFVAALFGQVFVDISGTSYLFDTQPSSIFGCADPDRCVVWIPVWDFGVHDAFVSRALNYSDESKDLSQPEFAANDSDSGRSDIFVYAIWQRSAQVSEPGTFALMSFFTLMLLRRRVNVK